MYIYIYIYIKPDRIEPGRIKRAASSLQDQNYHIICVYVFDELSLLILLVVVLSLSSLL